MWGPSLPDLGWKGPPEPEAWESLGSGLQTPWPQTGVQLDVVISRNIFLNMEFGAPPLESLHKNLKSFPRDSEA